MRALGGFTCFRTAITDGLPSFPAILYTSLKDLIPVTYFAHLILDLISMWAYVIRNYILSINTL